MSNPTKESPGNLGPATEDGTVPTDRTDVEPVEQWTQHTHGPRWDGLTHGRQMAEVADALAGLRRAYPGENG